MKDRGDGVFMVSLTKVVASPAAESFPYVLRSAWPRTKHHSRPRLMHEDHNHTGDRMPGTGRRSFPISQRQGQSLRGLRRSR